MPLSNDSWNVNADGDWATLANWSLGAVPNSNDDAIISTATIHTITHNSGADTVHSLTVGADHFVLNGGSLSLLAGASFALDYQQFGGTLTGAGNVAVSGAGTLLGGNAQGTLAFQIGGTIALGNYTLGGFTTLTNNGTTNQTATVFLGDNTGVSATITNSATGTYTIAGDYGIAQGAASASFVNAGLLQKSAGSGTTNINVSVTDTGSIAVANGTLQFNGPSNSFQGNISGAGQFAIGGNSTIAAGTSITANAFGVYGGTVTLNGNLSYGGTFYQEFGSVINLNGHNLTLSGTKTFYNQNFGTPTVNGSGTLATSGTTLLGLFVLGGTVNWSNTGTVQYGGQGSSTSIGDGSGVTATFTNQAAGTFNFVGDVNLARGSSAANLFTNAGTLAKTAGSGASFFDVGIASTGTITANTGLLQFRGPSNNFAGTISGAGQVAVGGGSSNTIAAGTSITSAAFGVYDNGTTVSLGGNLTYNNTFNQGYGTAIALNGNTLTLNGTNSLFNANFGTPTINTSGVLVTTGATALNNFVLGGTVNWQNSGTVTQSLSNTIGDSSGGAATFTNQATGKFNISNDTNLGHGSALTSLFTNAGTLAKTAGTGTSFVDVNVNSTGTINISSGVLDFRGSADIIGGTVAGAGQFALGGGGVTTISAATSITTSAWGIYDNGTSVKLGGALGYVGTFNLGFGTALNLNGKSLTLNGTNSFFNQNFGTPTVNGSGTLTTGGTTSLSGFVLGGTVAWNNNGTITQTATTQIGDSGAGAATFTNAAAGKFNIANDTGISRGTAATSKMVNAGALTKTGGTGVSVIGVNVTNTGTIEAQTGSIDMTGVVTGTGSFKIDAGAAVEFANSVATGTTATFTGATGVLRIDNLSTFAGAVTGFVAGDVIDLAGQSVKSVKLAGTTVSVTFANNSTSSLKLTTAVTGLQAVSDGAGGTNLIAAASSAALTTGADIYTYVSGANTLTGTAATLNASDSLTGGTGVDTLSLSGGGSFDLSALQAFSFDRVVLAAGANYNITAGQNDVASGNTLVINGGLLRGANSLTFNGSAITTGSLYLSGGAGADTLVGGGASTVFYGNGGNDTMTGGAGADTYVFNTALNAISNDPTITNFNVGTDLFNLSHTIFTALSAGALPPADFTIGSAATTSSQHVIYNSGTGALLYDSDGVGGAAATQFATLSTGLALTASNFKVT